MDDAVGLIEVEGIAAIIVAADAAAKAANVELLGWDSIGGFTTLFFRGSISDVATALQSGENAARGIVDRVLAVSITRPEAAYTNHIGFPRNRALPRESGALGLIETRGYGVQTQVCNAITKAAAVRVVNVLTVANRVVCALFLGDVEAVTEAMRVGRAALADYPHFLGSAILPQPVPEVLQTFGRRPATGGGGA